MAGADVRGGEPRLDFQAAAEHQPLVAAKTHHRTVHYTYPQRTQRPYVAIYTLPQKDRPCYHLVQFQNNEMSDESPHSTAPSCAHRHSRTYKRERCPPHLKQPTPTPLGGYIAALGAKGSGFDVALRLGMFPARLWVIQHGLSQPSLGEAFKMEERLGIPVQAWSTVPCVRWAIDKNVDPRRIAHSRRSSARKRYARKHPNAEARERLPATAPLRRRNRNWLELPTAPALLAALQPPPNLVRADAPAT